MPTRFVFTICQPGAETALKHDVARRHETWRFAFSRPGFVTFRVPEDDETMLRSAFARTWGISVGHARANDETAVIQSTWQVLAASLVAPRLSDIACVHLWSRERALPGDLDFDAESPIHDRALGERLVAAHPALHNAWRPSVNEYAPQGAYVLDCVLVEPLEWWLGWHRVGATETQWPGGAPYIAVPADMISRAYLKIEEAIAWSNLPVRSGDRVVEIGSAPGGACQALLARGCLVTGVDPAEMDPRVLGSPNFTHVRARAKDLKRSMFAGFRWLVSDANVAPNYTLDTVEAIVTHPDVAIEGLVLTLKLTDPKLAAKLPLYTKRIRTWGYAHVRARQLAYNRHEVCVIATARAPTPTTA